MTAPAPHLARVWGWPERRTRRKLDSWLRAGVIRRKGKLITVVAAKSDTPISVKRTANEQAQTEQADTRCATSDTNADLKSDTPTSVKRTGRSRASTEAGLPELPRERTLLVPLPPLAVRASGGRPIFGLVDQGCDLEATWRRGAMSRPERPSDAAPCPTDVAYVRADAATPFTLSANRLSRCSRAARISRTSHCAPQFLSGRGSSGTVRATVGRTSASRS